MRKLYNPKNQNKITQSAKRMAIEHNVTFNVIDVDSQKIVQSHEGHNAATNSMLTGLAHYLIGDGVYNQGYSMLSEFVPRYISLGTCGLFTQAEDSKHLPVGLGTDTDNLEGIDSTTGDKLYYGDPETERICHYIAECPGFGADGYSENQNNGRPYFGLGPEYNQRQFDEPIFCELINAGYPRVAISYRDIVPETEAEIPKTIDVIYSAMISTGALAQFRNSDDDYIFITEAGLWSRRDYLESGSNGLLAGYRIMPPNQSNWDFGTYIPVKYNDDGTQIPAHYDLDPEDAEHAKTQQANQQLIKQNILRVGRNQVVQVIWKLQLGGLEQLGSLSELYPSMNNNLYWHLWD